MEHKYDRGNYEKYMTANPLKRMMVQRLNRKILTIVNAAAKQAVHGQNRACTILDAGCGEGFLSGLISEHLKNVTVTGLEYVPQALKIARTMHAGAEFIQGDIYRMPFADGAFDLVLCTEVLEHLKDPAAALAELQRVAGRAVLLTVPDEPWFCMGNLLVCKHVKSLGNPPGHSNHWTYRGFLSYVSSPFLCGGGYLEHGRSFPWSVVLIQKDPGASRIL